jgi:hypothetical protein
MTFAALPASRTASSPYHNSRSFFEATRLSTAPRGALWGISHGRAFLPAAGVRALRVRWGHREDEGTRDAADEGGRWRRPRGAAADYALRPPAGVRFCLQRGRDELYSVALRHLLRVKVLLEAGEHLPDSFRCAQVGHRVRDGVVVPELQER